MATVMVAFAMIVSFAAPATIGVASASHNGDLSHDAVISADQNGNVYVYDGGQLVLETSVGGGVDHAEYDSTNNQIVLWHADANGNSTVTAISPSDGSQIWQTATSGTSGSIGPEHAYVTSQNSNSNLQIEKVDLGTGELVETHTISELGNLQQAEYVPGSGILVGHEDVDSSSTSTLAAIDAGTGSVQWTHSASGYIYGSAVNADGQYVYTMDGVGATVMLENTGNGYSEAWNTTSASGDSYQPAGVTFTSDGNVVVESTDSMGADDVYELSGSDGSEVNAYTASNAHYPQPGTFAADGNGTVFGVTGGPPTDVTTFDLSTGTQGSSGDAYSMSTTSYTMTTVYESMNYQTTPSTYTISGTVTDASGTALADASLTVTDSTGTQVASTTTASDGSYSVNVTGSDDYTVEVSASGYTSASKTQTVSSATTMDFSLEQASYSFSATVEDSSGSAIDGATVELLDSSDNVVSSGTTASDGTISLSAPSGSYDVQVSASGYDSATGTADLSTSGDSGTFQLAQSTFTVNGTVTDSSDNALENASVTLLDSSGNTVKEASTASDGTYSISGVKSGDYTVEVAASDYEAGSKTVTVDGAKTVDFSLAKTVWTNTYDRPTDGTPGKVFAEFTSSGNATVTVEAHNATSGEWETVVDAKQYTVEGSSNTTDTVEVGLDDYAGEDYDQYRVTVEDVEPSNTGVTEDTGGGGGLPGSDGGVPFVVVVVGAGLLLAGGAAIAFEE